MFKGVGRDMKLISQKQVLGMATVAFITWMATSTYYGVKIAELAMK